MSYNKDNFSKWFNKSSLNDIKQNMDSFINDSAKNFHSLFNSQKAFKVNMHETKTDVVVEAILPGYKRDQIQLGIIGNQFRITVENTTVMEEKGDDNEESSQELERLISLPFTISKNETKAIYQDGILKISTPKRKSTATIIDIGQ